MLKTIMTRTAMPRLMWTLLIAGLLAPATARAQDDVIYYHTDAIGSVRAITDASGVELARYEFLPFGERYGVTPTADPRMFAGKERDATTDLDYFGARDYLPVSGRFTTVDPLVESERALANPQLWNRYSYSLNNPLKFTDPDGRSPTILLGGIGAVVFGGVNAAVNVYEGRSWHQNLGVESAKGFVVGATLGLAAPVIGAASLATAAAVEAGVAATTLVGSAGAAAAKNSTEIGRIIGWGTGQTATAVAQTVRVTSELTPTRVAQLAQQGVTRAWVEKQLSMYQSAVEAGKTANTQLLPRIELMKKLLEHLPLQ